MAIYRYKSVFSEEAKSLGNAKSENICLWHRGERTDEIRVVLYIQPQIIKNELIIRSNNFIVAQGAMVYTLPSPYRAMEIQSTAAQKGYGPLLYDILMTYSPYGIYGDRMSISPKAQSVWNYYCMYRKDVKKQKIDDVTHPATPTPIDDGKINNQTSKNQFEHECINNVFKIVKPLSLTALENKNSGIFQKLESIIENFGNFKITDRSTSQSWTYDDVESFEEFLEREADFFFQEQYGVQVLAFNPS